jgi:hypothetical protein
MKWIHVSETTHRALADAAIYPWRETGRRQADGSWLIPMGDEVFERLDEERLYGESDDDLIMRIIRDHRGDKPS